MHLRRQICIQTRCYAFGEKTFLLELSIWTNKYRYILTLWICCCVFLYKKTQKKQYPLEAFKLSSNEKLGPKLESNHWTPHGDKWSSTTLQRRPNGPPQVTNRAPMAVQRHPRQPKCPQRPPRTGQKSPMKPKTQKITRMASFRCQYLHFNVPSGTSNINFKTSRQ